MRKLSFGMLTVLLVAMLAGGVARRRRIGCRFTPITTIRIITFSTKPAFFSAGGLAYLSAMNEQWTENVHDGSTAIQCQFEARIDNWGGWYFQNGVVLADAEELTENWGTYPSAGLDLSAFSKLTFFARGKEGGEKVDFFCLGIGRNAKTGATQADYPYPDSSPKQNTGYQTLNTEWNAVHHRP